MTGRRFPPSRSIVENPVGFVITDGQALTYIDFEDEAGGWRPFTEPRAGLELLGNRDRRWPRRPG
jgi:hypothetical protein